MKNANKLPAIVMSIAVALAILTGSIAVPIIIRPFYYAQIDPLELERSSGQSLTLARNPRDFYELDKDNVVIDINCFDAPVRQEVKHDPRKAKTMKNDRVTFTEEQVKAEASRCLGCGVSVVDQNKCIGCGLCTTRCEFDAIHLHRDHPDASKMVRTDDKIPPLAAYAAKRAVKIKIKDLKEKLAK